MVDFTSTIDNLNALTTSLNQYVVTPLNAFGLGGYVFDIEGEARAELASDITDHFVEDNSFIQDHIATKPKRITLRNYVGELVYVAPNNATNTGLVQAVQKLTELTAIAPQLTASATQAYNIINQQISGQNTLGTTIAAAANTGANIFGLLKNLISAQANKQQAAYQYFKALRDAKMIFSIQTPFEFMTNMAIENIVAIQPEDSIYISNFIITMKEIRTASTSTVKVNNVAAPNISSSTSPSFATISGQQSQTPTQLGTVPTVAPPAANPPIMNIPLPAQSLSESQTEANELNQISLINQLIPQIASGQMPTASQLKGALINFVPNYPQNVRAP